MSAAQGSDPADIVAFVKDLTFQEVHAFTWGLGLLGAGHLAGSNGQPEVATAFYAAYVAVLGRAMLGQRLRDLLPAVRIVAVPKYVIRQVRREPHYYISGGLAAEALRHAPEALEYVLQFVPF